MVSIRKENPDFVAEHEVDFLKHNKKVIPIDNIELGTTIEAKPSENAICGVTLLHGDDFKNRDACFISIHKNIEHGTADKNSIY